MLSRMIESMTDFRHLVIPAVVLDCEMSARTMHATTIRQNDFYETTQLKHARAVHENYRLMRFYNHYWHSC